MYIYFNYYINFFPTNIIFVFLSMILLLFQYISFSCFYHIKFNYFNKYYFWHHKKEHADDCHIHHELPWILKELVKKKLRKPIDERTPSIIDKTSTNTIQRIRTDSIIGNERHYSRAAGLTAILFFYLQNWNGPISSLNDTNCVWSQNGKIIFWKWYDRFC